MSPDSPAGKAANELARRIRALGENGDCDPDVLAHRFMGDLVARGWRLTEARTPAGDPMHRKAGTPRYAEHAAGIRASLPKPDGAE